MKNREPLNPGITPYLIFFIFGFILLFSMNLPAATFTVNTTADTTDAVPGDGIAEDASGNCSVRAAIMEANALTGTDTIVIPAGTYLLTITGTGENNCKKGDLDIRSNLNIEGAGKTLTIIDGNQLDRVFHIKGAYQVNISRMTIRNGKSPDGTTISSASYFRETITQAVERSKKKEYEMSPRYSLRNRENKFGHDKLSTAAAIEAGDGGDGGGILNNKATLTIDNCKILNNQTGNGGDYLLSSGGDSGYGGNGGGLYNLEGTVVINTSAISGNTTGKGGHDSSHVYGGAGGDGGGIFNLDGTMNLNNCLMKDNRCGDYGTGYERDGYGGCGGGICSAYSYGNNSTLTLTGCTIKNNRTGDGGWWDGAAGAGGGIENRGAASIYRCLIYNNSCGEGAFDGVGGGICNSGNLKIFNSTISANSYGDTSEAYGGGLFNGGGNGFALLESCTVTGNNYDGICNNLPELWIYDPPTSVVKIHNTISANHLIYIWATSSYVANDCIGKIKSMGYNLIEGTYFYCDIVGNTTGNIYGADPVLGPLSNNGGPTRTHALLSTSPCLDSGDTNDYEDTDQRGVLRPKDGDGDMVAEPDIGAFEKFTPSITITFPLHGATVWGTVTIKAQSNTKYVDFYVDNTLLHTDDSEPFTCDWDTAAYSNSSHNIKTKGYDSSGGLSDWDSIIVNINNTILGLKVERRTISAWLIKRDYGRLTFTKKHTGSSSPVKYVIERKEGNGNFSPIKEVPAADVQGSNYTYDDCYLSKDVTYTYRVSAYNSGGVKVGQSDEKAI